MIDHGVVVTDSAPAESFDLAVLPIHCPRTFLDGCRFDKIIDFSQAVNRYIDDGRFRIEVTGVKGKTSACYLISKILHDSGRKVLLHSSRGEGPWTDDGHLIERKTSIAPPYLMTLPAGDYDAMVCEVSLGGSGKADIALITNLVSDYGIAKNSLKASDGKKDILTDKVNIVSENEAGIWSAYGHGLTTYGSSVRAISEPGLGKPLKVAVDYLGGTEIELKGTYVQTEYLEAMDAAIGVCSAMNIEKDALLHSLETFEGVPGRGEIIREGNRTIVRERNPGISAISVKRTMECLQGMNALGNAMVVLDPVNRKVCDKMDAPAIREIVESYGVPIAITDGDGRRPEIPSDVGVLVELIKEGYQ